MNDLWFFSFFSVVPRCAAHIPTVVESLENVNEEEPLGMPSLFIWTFADREEEHDIMLW